MLPGGQEGAISGAVGTPLAQQHGQVETEKTVERAANIIALVSTFHFLLFLDLFSQIDLNPQERLPSFFKTDHATNKWK